MRSNLKKYKAIWTKTEDLKKIKLNVLRVFDDRYMKANFTCKYI